MPTPLDDYDWTVGDAESTKPTTLVITLMVIGLVVGLVLLAAAVLLFIP